MSAYPISGQVFIRDTGDTEHAGRHRRLVVLVGIVAIPDDSPLVGEHQYAIGGQSVDDLFIAATQGKDLTAMARGQSIAGLLQSPIWRC